MDDMDHGVAKSLEFETDANVTNSLVGLVKARDVHLTDAGAGFVAAEGNFSILNGGCGPVIANGGVTIRNGGCGSHDRERRCLDRVRGNARHLCRRQRDDRPESDRRFRRLPEGHRGGWREGPDGSAPSRGVRGGRRRGGRAALSFDQFEVMTVTLP